MVSFSVRFKVRASFRVRVSVITLGILSCNC